MKSRTLLASIAAFAVLIFFVVLACTAKSYSYESGGPGRIWHEDGTNEATYVGSWGFKERAFYWCNQKACVYIGREAFSFLESLEPSPEGGNIELRQKVYTYIVAYGEINSPNDIYGFLNGATAPELQEFTSFINGRDFPDMEFNFTFRTHIKYDPSSYGMVASYDVPAMQIPTSTSVAKATLPTELVSTPNNYLIVDQSNQKMYVMNGAEIIRTILISTGADGYDTPAWEGVVGAERTYFNTVDGQIADIGWKLFYARVGWVMIHTVPYTYKDYVGMEKIYHGLDALGSYRLSGGCIWVSDQDALWLQAWGVVGVPITISPKEEIGG